MMTSLLSMFDPSSSIFSFLSLNWLSMMFIFMPFSIFIHSSKSFFVFNQLFIALNKAFNWSFRKENIILVGAFLFIYMFNKLSLFPYFFSSTSHFGVNFSMAFVFFLTSTLFGVMNHFHSFVAHLTPMGCPMMLVPFMVVIELISFLIRPITLSLRLMANLLAGHLMLELGATGVLKMSIIGSMGLFPVITGFSMFEMGVALVQAYVFTSLTSLYWSEMLDDNH